MLVNRTCFRCEASWPRWGCSVLRSLPFSPLYHCKWVVTLRGLAAPSFTSGTASPLPWSNPLFICTLKRRATIVGPIYWLQSSLPTAATRSDRSITDINGCVEGEGRGRRVKVILVVKHILSFVNRKWSVDWKTENIRLKIVQTFLMSVCVINAIFWRLSNSSIVVLSMTKLLLILSLYCIAKFFLSEHLNCYGLVKFFF